MKQGLSTVAVAAVTVLCLGCGGDDEQPLPNASPGNLDVERVDWVVDGMSCEGEEVTRLVSVVEEEDDDGNTQLKTQHRRGDDCIDEGELFWDEIPEFEGDEVSVTLDPDAEPAVFVAEMHGQHAIRLLEVGGDVELLLRLVYPTVSPTANPDLSELEMVGEWWMEGYPCHEEQVPQLVRVLPGVTQMTKVVGDACIGDGESFFAGERSGTSISGQADLGADWNGSDDDDDIDWTEATGTVLREDFIRLNVAGQSVSLRRVLAESE